MNVLDTKTKLLFAAAITLVVLVFLSIIYLVFQPGKNVPKEEPAMIPANRELTPLQRSVINKTTDEEIAKRSDIINQTSTRDGGKKYTLPAANPLMQDEIRTKNGVVIFEKTNTQTYQFGALQKLQDYTDTYGQPEAVVNNIAPYGWNASAYIYASKGFTFIANKFTKSVYEIQRFVPMTVNEYKAQYAAFLQPAPEPKDEFNDSVDGKSQ